jgi:hypothetical protein
MSFFKSGAVDVKHFDRSKLSEGTYRIRIVDAADHMAAFSGNRTQFDFIVTAGPHSIGLRKGHIVGHVYDQAWKSEKARGEILSILGAFKGMTRDAAGMIKDPGEFVDTHTRTLGYVDGGKKVGTMSRSSDELPLVKEGAEAILIVKLYKDKKTGKQKFDKHGQKSVTYDFMPLSCGFTPSAPGTSEAEDDGAPVEMDDLPPPPSVDALELAIADGWKVNPNAPEFFYKKGEAKQLRAEALRAKYEGGAQ